MDFVLTDGVAMILTFLVAAAMMAAVFYMLTMGGPRQARRQVRRGITKLLDQ